MLNNNDKFLVKMESLISDYDRKILIRLYQPICGGQAIALYFTLWSELEADKTLLSVPLEISYLLRTCHFSLEDFTLSLRKLEGLGLLKTYRHEDENEEDYYVFALYAPKSPYEFFTYPIFVSLLSQNLSAIDFAKTRAYFTRAELNKEKLVDLSATFNDAYAIPNNAKFIESGNEIGHHSNNPTFDFDTHTFYKRLRELQVSKNKISKDNEDEFALLSTTHNLSAYDMANIVASSIKSDGTLDLSKVRSKAKMKATPLEVKEIKNVNIGNESLDSKIEMFNKLSCAQFMAYKNGGINNEHDKRLVEKLKDNTGLVDPVINALVDYCLELNDNKLVYSYMEAIAGSLLRNKIDSALEAMVYLNNSQRKEKQTQIDNKPVEEDISLEDAFASLNKLKEMEERRNQ